MNPTRPPHFLQKLRGELLRRFRRFLLRQVQAEQKRLMSVWPADFYQRGKWTGVLNALGESGPHAKQTFHECINWYLFGLDYVRACARALKGDGSGKEN